MQSRWHTVVRVAGFRTCRCQHSGSIPLLGATLVQRWLKESMNMLAQEVNNIPFLMEGTTRLLALRSSRQFSAGSVIFRFIYFFPIKSLKRLMGCRVHGRWGLVTVSSFASRMHHKSFWIENFVKIKFDLIYSFKNVFGDLKEVHFILRNLRLLLSYQWWRRTWCMEYRCSWTDGCTTHVVIPL